MDNQTYVYATKIKDINMLEKSSSGGMFVVLSDYILSNGGVVVCAIYNYETKKTEFSLVKDSSERDKAIGSKYMQSIPGNIFKYSYEWIKENPEKKLMFIGMGCQVAGFKSYVNSKNISENVYFVDIICHGSPSPKLWIDYASYLENKYNGKITYLAFKDKRNGWLHPTSFVKINNEEIFINEYVKIFYNKSALRPSCYKCPYTTTERYTDLTIGDFWGIDKKISNFFDKKGNSLVLIHTDKGQHLFENIKNKINYVESNTKDCLQPNLIKPTSKSEMRSIFWKEYYEKGIKYIIKNYGSEFIFYKFKLKIKKIFALLTKSIADYL